MRPEECKVHEGNYSFYVEGVEKQRETRDSNSSPVRAKSDRRGSRPPQSKSAPSPYDRLSVDDLEELIVDRESELATLRERFGDPAVYNDLALLVDLQERAKSLETELAEIDAGR